MRSTKAAREANGRFVNRPYGCTTKMVVGAHHDAPVKKAPPQGEACKAPASEIRSGGFTIHNQIIQSLLSPLTMR